MNLLLLTALLMDTAGSDYKVEFENAWVRVVRVHYDAHEKTAMHDHPATPTVYIYTTDGGRLRISHDEDVVIRPAVKAGGIRYQHGVFERHVVEELDGTASEYLRLELKIEPADLPDQDVRRAPADRTPYESRMLRILRVTCPARSACPAPAHPENPAIVISGREFHWMDAGARPPDNPLDAPVEQVRVELVSKPK
jgi:hypothetical protein